MGAFADSVRASVEKTKLKVDYTVTLIAQDLFKEIVYMTPVLDGYLINNWFTKVGGGFSTATSPIPDQSGGGSLLNISSMFQQKPFYGKDGVVTMANNLPYAYRIEYLGWSRMKAPYGMVRISLGKVAAKYR